MCYEIGFEKNAILQLILSLVIHFFLQQEAVAHGFQREYEVFGTPDSYLQQLPAVLCQKRNKLASCLEGVGLRPIMPEGGYFIVADISSVSECHKSDLHSRT